MDRGARRTTWRTADVFPLFFVSFFGVLPSTCRDIGVSLNFENFFFFACASDMAIMRSSEHGTPWFFQVSFQKAFNRVTAPRRPGLCRTRVVKQFRNAIDSFRTRSMPSMSASCSSFSASFHHKLRVETTTSTPTPLTTMHRVALASDPILAVQRQTVEDEDSSRTNPSRILLEQNR